MTIEETMVCPHCRVRKTMESSKQVDISEEAAHFVFVCGNCERPLIVFAKLVTRKPRYRGPGYDGPQAESFQQAGWKQIDSWPKPEFRTGEAPRGVPEPIAALFEQSKNAALKQAYDLAIMGFQRVLKMAQADHSPEFKGNVQAWILSLINNRRVTADMRIWTNQLKLRSEIEGATGLDTDEFATFVHVLLEQIYYVRSRISSFRKGGVEAQPLQA